MATLVVPSQLGLVGTPFHNQALVVDPGAGNPAGFVLSAAAPAAIGR